MGVDADFIGEFLEDELDAHRLAVVQCELPDGS
jgi:hypothetical protein